MFQLNTSGLTKVLMIAALGAVFSTQSSAQVRDGLWYKTCSGIQMSADKSKVDAMCQKADGKPVPASWKINGLQLYAEGLVFTWGANTYRSFCKDDLTFIAPPGEMPRFEATCKGGPGKLPEKKYSVSLNLKNVNGALVAEEAKLKK